jgi:hypothetical protein
LEGPELYDELGEYRHADIFDNLLDKQKNLTNYKNTDTLDLFWKVLSKVTSLNPVSYDDKFEITYFLPQLLFDILNRYDEQAYVELVEIYKSLPDTSFLREEAFLIPFYNFRVYKEIKYVLEEQIPPSTGLNYLKPPENEKSPNHKNSYFEYYRKLYTSVREHYDQRVLNDTACGWFSFQSNERLFYKTIEDILFNSTKDDFKNLSKFRWGGWCGTGSEFYYSKKLLVELLILLRERDFLSILGRKDYYSGPNLDGKIKIKLIGLCNINWIDYYTGAILSGELSDVPSIFTKSGSDKAAMNLLELKDSIQNKAWYITKCAEFINPESEKERKHFDFFDSNMFLSEYEFNLLIPIDTVKDKIKKKLKKEIINISSTADEFYLCQALINALYKIEFDEEVKEAFLLHTKSKFSTIRGNAANILKKKGIVVSLPSDDGKIKYKFLVDGKPLKKDRIRWELYNDSKPDRSFLNGSEKTSEEGILLLTRDILLDRINEITRIIFYPDNWNDGGKQVIFYCESQLPQNLNDTTLIQISTVKISINFHLNRNTDFYQNKKMRLHAFPPKMTMITFETDIKKEFELPVRFQKNIKCSFSAYVPGALPWFSPFRDTIKNDMVMDAYLENGTTVTFKLIPPGDNKADKGVLFELERIGKSTWDNFFHYDYFEGGYEALPVGEYRLIISSSAEKKSKFQKDENECKEQIIADYPDYEGKIISFTITEGSPEHIDLGSIKLEALKK